MATWAKGIDFKNTTNTTRIGGVGMYGTDSVANKIYLGFGTEPWSSTGLEITSSDITYKGNKVYHAGNKPTAADVGALTQSTADGRYVRQEYLNGYYGMTANGSGTSWVRTTNSGIIPYQSGGASALGTSGWPFNSIYANDIYDNGVLLENKFAAASHTHNYLPLSGGTLTGSIKFSSGDYTGNAIILEAGDVSGAYMGLGAGGLTVIGSGESTAEVRKNMTAGNKESMIVASDYEIQFLSGMQNGYEYGKAVTITATGVLQAPQGVTGALTGNASTATTLQTARTINGTSFNGSANITTANWGTARTITIGTTGKSVNGSANVSWSLAEIGALPLTGGSLTGVINNNFATTTYLAGNQGKTLINSTCSAGTYTMLYKYPSTNGYFTMGGYQGNYLLNYTAKTTVDAGTNAVTKSVTLLSENGNSSFPGTVSAPTFSGALSGNATTATTLATARTINGTSFNGSANITTANWGTARTITIGTTGKSVNGSANVSWSLAEIGAAAASHTHSYLPLSGGNLTGAVKSSSNITASKFIVGADPNGSASLGYDSTTTDTYICNAGGNWLRLKTDKSLTYAGYKVYTAYQKPTASEVGALATTGGTLSGNLSLRNTSTVAGIQLYRGSSTAYYTRIAQADESGNLRIENYSNNAIVADYVFANGNFSPRRGNPYLGYSTYRWGQIYSTIGSISTSDSRLKENIKAINKTEVRALSNEPTSYDFYNYVKGTGVYTFNYKREVSNDNQTWLGILADEIPDNIFDKIGMMSKTQEEYEKELEKQQELITILEKTPAPLSEDESINNIIEGTSYTYDELKYQAERIIEEPIRMINSSSQIAMLQEVLSIALNKIDALENKIEYLDNKLKDLNAL